MRTTMVSFGLMLLILIWDFSSRLMPDSNMQASDLSGGMSALSPVATLSKSEREHIETQLNNYLNKHKKQETKSSDTPRKKKQQPKKPDIMSAAEQQQQEGRLTELIDGVSKFTLRATFSKGQSPFAIVEQADLETERVRSFEVREGEMMATYRVDKVSEFAVQLSKGTRQITLQLFRTN